MGMPADVHSRGEWRYGNVRDRWFQEVERRRMAGRGRAPVLTVCLGGHGRGGAVPGAWATALRLAGGAVQGPMGGGLRGGRLADWQIGGLAGRQGGRPAG
jgi:hypothetical protein